MKYMSKLVCRNVKRIFVSGALLGLSLVNVNAFACGAEFYVVWMEAEASTQIYVRSFLVQAAGNTDRYGVMTVPDDALGNPNPSYIHRLLTAAFMNNSKLFITTNDTDCEISGSGENLGTITDAQTM